MLLLGGLILAAPKTPEEQLLATAPIDQRDAGLLEFLRKRSMAKVDPTQLKKLIDQLSASTKEESEQAARELVAFGSTAAPALRDALKNTGLNKAKPIVEDCLRWIDGPDAAALTRAVVRTLGQRKPAGTLPVLLSFLPHADEEAIADDARQILTALAVRDGKPNPDLIDTALKEADLPRRHAAIEIVCQAELRETIRKLYRDASRDIRLRTANIRLEQGDIEAVEVFIDLLGEPASPEARGALDSLQRLAGPLATDPALGMPPKRAAWTDWWKGITDESMLKYFRDRTPNIDPDTIADIVELLGSKTFRVRQKAESDLIKLRGLSIPHLERALKDPDLEVRRRAERCLESIRSAPEAPLSAAWVRLLGLRRPADAAKILLAFVAFADADSVVEEARQTLRLLVKDNRSVVAVLRTGLSEKSPQRRGLAAEVLAEFGGPEHLPALRKLLGDFEPLVRLRVAMGLALRQEREAIPILIDLLGMLPLEQAWPVEDSLRRIAGSKAPVVPLDETQAARQGCRTAWSTWWKELGGKSDLTALQRRPTELGLTLASLWESGTDKCCVVEMGRDQKQRWKIEGLGYVFDFVVLPGNRLLMTENTKGRVTERNFKGEVLWQYDIAGPINCQRLPNGHTFICTSDRAVIVDRQKNEVLKVDRQSGLMGGQRFRDGRIVVLTGGGQCSVFDPRGEILKQFQIEGGMSNYGGVQELANGRFMIAQHDRNTVSEYDLDGKLMWKAESPSPNFATRLANGNTLVGSQDNRSLIELDRDGKQVSRYEPGFSVWRVRRR
jgi:HEAT repeat protein